MNTQFLPVSQSDMRARGWEEYDFLPVSYTHLDVYKRQVGISPPNAAYKINNLIQKGYVRKEQSEEDKREYHLVVTQKYIDYYNISYSYLGTVMARIRARFPEEDVKKIEEMLDIISGELMPEIPLPRLSPRT